jgi:transcriptional regulator with XRE-family HTH domain
MEAEVVKWSVVVATLRTLLGWNQGQLEEASGVYPRALSKYELEWFPPSKENRRKVEKALGFEDGWPKEVEIFLGGLRAEMTSPNRGLGDADEIQEAAAEASRLMQSALWLGIEYVREGETSLLPWSRFIVTLRTLRGWSQADLGEVAGIDKMTVNRAEVSGRPTPSVKAKLEGAFFGTSRLRAEIARFHLGGLRALMRAPQRAAVMAGIVEAGDVNAQFVEAALRAGRRQESLGARKHEVDPNGHSVSSSASSEGLSLIFLEE